MKISLLFAAVAVATSLAAPLAQAQAVPIIGGNTAVTLTSASALNEAGLSVAPLGSATVVPDSNPPIINFGITGGSIDLNTFAGTIEHDGSGFSLSDDDVTVELRNFVINTVTLVLSGDVTANGSMLDDVGLLNIGLSGIEETPFSLTLTDTAAGLLSSIFFSDEVDLTGFELGLASTQPITAAIPEPETYALMLAGLVAVGFAARRRRA